MALLAVFDSTFFYGAKVNWMGMETILYIVWYADSVENVFE